MQRYRQHRHPDGNREREPVNLDPFATIGEGGMSLLYNYYALFQAKAFVLQESRQELSKYLDVPAFTVGDLFYIQNLVALLETP